LVCNQACPQILRVLTICLVILAVVLLVRWQLQPVNVEELSRLKYDYKGA
jgi:hypothetical protein